MTRTLPYLPRSLSNDRLGTLTDTNREDHGKARLTADQLEPEWELFDLEKDPSEMHNVYGDPDYAGVVVELTDQLHRLQAKVGDNPYGTE